jgi:hypothetical protein
MLSLRSTVVASKDQVSSSLGEETAILHIGGGVYYSLNPVGAQIWALLQQPVVVGELRDRLLAQFDVEPGRLEQDLHNLLGDLAREGLIEVQDEPGC